MKKVFSVGDNCVDPEFMIQGSSEPNKEKMSCETRIVKIVLNKY